MSPLRALLYPLLLCVSLLAHGVPSSDQVQASLNGLAERKLAEAEEAAIKATLEQTLAFLRQRDNSDSQLKALRQQLEQAPRQVTQNQRELAQLKQQDTQQPGQPVTQSLGGTAGTIARGTQQATGRVATGTG